MDANNKPSLRIGGLLVSRMVTDDLQQPRFMYREKRTRPEDSGWRIFTGMESEEYLEDPANCAIYRAETILAIDQSIGLLLSTGIGSVFERNDDNFWERVTDFPLEDDFRTVQQIDGWELDVNNLFERHDEDGEAYFTTGDKSIRVSIWKEDGQPKDVLTAWIRGEIANRDESDGAVLQQFDFVQEDMQMLGYTVVEQDEHRVYQVMLGWAIRDEAFAYLSFYFDDPADQDWALATWKSVRPALNA